MPPLRKSQRVANKGTGKGTDRPPLKTPTRVTRRNAAPAAAATNEKLRKNAEEITGVSAASIATSSIPKATDESITTLDALTPIIEINDTPLGAKPSRLACPPKSRLTSAGENNKTLDASISTMEFTPDANERDVEEEVAAAASTAVYRERYQSPSDPNDFDYGAESWSDSESDESSSHVDIDDDDYVDIDVDSESEDENRSSFPKAKNPSKHMIIGGPQPRSTEGMTLAEAKMIIEEDRKIRKSWTDVQRKQRLKENNIGCPPGDNDGFNSDLLRIMAEVEVNRLREGHMFSTKDIFWMRIGEEANLRNIHVRCVRSDHFNLTISGPNFYVHGTFREGYGWKCLNAICRDGDDLSKIPPAKTEDNRRAAWKTPLFYKWLVPIFRSRVEKDPGVDYETLRDLVRPYANDYAITNALIQRGRDETKLEIFGTPENNVGYAEGVAKHMRDLGHTVNLLYSSRKDTLSDINTIVVNEEVIRRKNGKSKGLLPLDGIDERKAYWKKWKEDNALFLSEALGIKGAGEDKFLSGILVATSSSKNMFPLTQEVVQADGAHTSFGKYTLFSAYTTTANANMSPVAFGLIFGNENIKNWTLFWNFVTSVHPSINRPQVTIMTDQDKGSIKALAQCIPLAHNFHCSYHRRENIIKACGGGKGKKPLTALWLYNKLSDCSNMRQVNVEITKYLDKLHERDRHYLTKLENEKQYAAARCAMRPDVCMYGRSSSSGVESMNRANKLVREKTAIDILNAAILLLKLEGERYHTWKTKAWERDHPFTPRGMDIMSKVFEDVNAWDYRMSVLQDVTTYTVSVSRNAAGSREYIVRLPKVEYKGSHFGTCTCGIPSKEGIPCQHMAVIVKSSNIPSLTRTNIMPFFWSTAHWQSQYALDVDCKTDISMNTVKATSHRDEKLRYCPDWSVSDKPGRPKKNDKIMTLTDKMEMASSSKKRKRQGKLYCNICEKFNHNTAQCFKNPINRNLDNALEEILVDGDEEGVEGRV